MRLSVLAGAVLVAAHPAFAAPRSLSEDARTFGVRETVQSVEISPSGRSLLLLVSGAGRASHLRVVDVASKRIDPILAASGDPERLNWCRFGSDEQIVCSYGGNLVIDDAIVGFSRLVAVDRRTKKLSPLGQRQSYYSPALTQSDGAILDWLPDTPGAVLMARSYAGERFRSGSNIRDTREGLGVDRVDLATLKSKVVETPRQDVSGYMTDGHGNIRLAVVPLAQGERGDLTGVIRYNFRPAGSRDWRELGRYNVNDRSGLYPLAIERESDSAYVLKKLNGRDALYRVRLDGSGAEALVASNALVDIDGVVRVGRGQQVIGYTFAEEQREARYFDPTFDKLATTLGKATKGGITFVGASSDSQTLLVHSADDISPGGYHLFDRKTRRLDEVVTIRPELDGRTLATVKAVQVPVGGGVAIPAYLTLPPGSSGRNLPAIVMPHGGPSSRDELGFDWLAQFLAARGYAVIQPNFRGSAGYGEEFEGANGFRDWERAIGDIGASARWLAAQGIADSKRMAILGWSYGGYAALQSAAVTPDLYKAAVAIAPVTDFALLRQHAEDFTNADIVKRQIGSGEALALGSPLRQVARIRVPVLMAHGDMDANVGVAHSDRMLAALQAQGTKAELLRFKGLDHQLEDSDARIRMLTRIGEFLDNAIGQ